MSVVGVSVAVLTRTLQHLGLHQLQDLAGSGLNLIQGYEVLFAGITTNDDSLILFDILGADLDTQRNAADLLLAELPAGALFTVIDLDAVETAKTLRQLGSLLQRC